ncbi:hypothetical protein, partial [uncultured Muribaculum sp.]
FDLRKISASQNNSENKSSVGSVSGLAKAEQPQILPNHCYKYTMFFLKMPIIFVFHKVQASLVQWFLYS